MRSPSIFAWVGCRAFLILFGVLLVSAPTLSAFEASSTPSKAKAANSWTVVWQPVRVTNGSPVVLRVTSPTPLQSLSGKWLAHDVFFSSEQGGKLWYGIAGASLETRPGVYALELKGVTANGQELSFQKQLGVGKGKYHSILASVPKQYTEPNIEQLHKIDQDKALKEHAFSQMTSTRQWDGDFLPPVKAQVSDVFGTSRTFNGRVQSVHQGLDYAVPEGTPVAALNGGTVVLAQPLFFEGNFVVLDHGQGLLTMYMHLSKIEVKEGDRIARGQTVGLSGGTGRATGPHLHIAVRWQGVYLNPETLLSLQLP